LSTLNVFDRDVFTVYIQEPSAPAAGAVAVISSPNNQRAQLVGAAFRLVTDANAANRYAIIERAEAPVNQRIGVSQIAHTAGTTAYYTAIVGAPPDTGTNPPLHMVPLIDSPLFFEGDAMRINIYNIQAGDQIDQIILTWHLWPYSQ